MTSLETIKRKIIARKPLVLCIEPDVTYNKAYVNTGLEWYPQKSQMVGRPLPIKRFDSHLVDHKPRTIVVSNHHDGGDEWNFDLDWIIPILRK